MAAALSRLLRALGDAVHGTGTLAMREAAADDAVRAPVGTSRRLTFVAADGGTGTTTTAAACARILASRRGGPVLALDAAGGASGLAVRCGAGELVELGTLTDDEPARTLAEASGRLPRAPHGLRVAGTSPWREPVSAWTGAVGAVGRFFEIVVTDAGRRTPGEAVPFAAASHAVAVVARTDAGSLGSAADLVLHLREQAPRTPVVLVAVGVGGPLPGGVAAAPWPIGPPHVVPHDHVAAASLATPVPQLAAPTVTALTDLAATLLTCARAHPGRAA
ncbi:hypothetical protein [Myceligenerans indicum]|uniref:MinD-like ATPase involved in chromosome partitioning or flagellar assembly n=1 Tax=Myceligenerans indicum TaxID=2593663 RepID=A0ABS1LG71_9MICO|nr:hypothetical protein [Myceligenerans indicum]MBL0884838.1 hypothetical protein [Myceligenerans indicum]